LEGREGTRYREKLKKKKRLISEMIHIRKQKHGLNSQNDTELLDPLQQPSNFIKRN